MSLPRYSLFSNFVTKMTQFLFDIRYRLLISSVHVVLLVSVLGIAGCGHASRDAASAPTTEGWHEFQGTWTAAGRRYVMSLGADRQTTIANLDGSIVLQGPNRPALGFRAEAMLLNDTATGLVGRAVWTDELGDQAYSELKVENAMQSKKIYGTFLGGTGRYAGITGTYDFAWRFLLETEDGTVQGQSIGLQGRVQISSGHPASGVGDPKP